MSTGMEADIRLLRASLRGNSDAFAALVRKYQSLICAITYSSVGEVTVSEELAQETFVSAWRNLGRLEDLTKFRPWLCHIARNTVIEWTRRRKRDLINTAYPLDAVAAQPAKVPSPVEQAISKERQAIVRQAIGQMPERHRQALVLYYRHQKSTSQVAEQLGISESGARQRIWRARKMLKAQVSAIVEETIARTGPGEAFTLVVVTSIAGLALESSAEAAACASAQGATAKVGLGTTLLGVKAKLVVALAVTAMSIVGMVAYQRSRQPNRSGSAESGVVVRREQPSGKTATATDRGSYLVTDEEPVAPTVEQDGMSGTVGPADEALPANAAGKPASQVQTGPSLSGFVPRGVLSGIVTDAETGEPIEEAWVSIWGLHGRRVGTDANGFYFFDSVKEAGDYRIEMYCDAYYLPGDGSSLSVHLEKDSQLVRHFELKPACQIEVHVVDENSMPIEGAILAATLQGSHSENQLVDSWNTPKTDEQGTILLGGFKPTETKYLFTARHPDYAAGILAVSLSDPNVVEYGRIVLAKGVEVKGYAEYLNGTPATDVRIGVRPDWWHINVYPPAHPVDRNGYFMLKHIVAGTYRIEAHMPRHPDGTGEVRRAGSTPLPLQKGELLTVTIPASSPQSLVAISGTVSITGDASPLHIDIRAHSADGYSGDCTLRPDANGLLDGNFVIDRLEPDAYTLRVIGPGVEPKIIENVSAPAEGIEIELSTMKPRLKGLVVDANSGNPVELFRVRARQIRNFGPRGYVHPGKWTEFNNSEGKFEIGVTGRGIYEVQVGADGYAWVWSEQVDTEQKVLLTIPLGRGGSIEGRVTNSKGEAINHAKIVPLSKASGVNASARNRFVSEDGAVESINGRFVLENLAAGTETIKVSHSDYCASIVGNLEVEEGRVTKGVEVVLSEGGIIAGYVYDAEGKPERDVTLHFQDARSYDSVLAEEAGRLATVATDANGFYRVRHLPQGRCYVRRHDEWNSLGVVRQTSIPKSGAVATLDFGVGSVVTGRVIFDGQRLAQAKVQLGSDSSPVFSDFRCLAVTNSRGKFVFRGVRAGAYSIYLAEPALPRHWIHIGDVEVHLEDVDVGSLPRSLADIIVSISCEGEARCNIKSVHLWGNTQVFGRRVEDNSPQAGELFLIEDMIAGSYGLHAVRNDGVQFRQTIVITGDQREVGVDMSIPYSSAAVCGVVFGEPPGNLMMWRSDGNVFTHLELTESATYRVANLPAGRYFIGRKMKSGDEVMASFELSDAEEEVVDVVVE